jgi:hypothetical protein
MCTVHAMQMSHAYVNYLISSIVGIRIGCYELTAFLHYIVKIIP